MMDVTGATGFDLGGADVKQTAQASVKAFRKMEPMMNGYVRALTGKSLRVKAAANSMTDGKTVYLRPPIALGIKVDHERSICDKRDKETYQLRCPACDIREKVLITLYHEISHIAYGSFDSVNEDTRRDTLDRAVQLSGKRADVLNKKIDAVVEASPEIISAQALAGTISPFLPIINNSVEDARVNRQMFRARPGTLVMRMSQILDTFTKGIDLGNGQVEHWIDRPEDMQIIVALHVATLGISYIDWFSERVVTALDDPELKTLITKIDTLGSVNDTYALSFPLLERLRELGFCKLPDDPEETLEESEPEEPDQQDETPEEESDDETAGDAEDSENQGENDAESEQDDSEGGNGDSTSDQDGRGSESDDSEGDDSIPGSESSDSDDSESGEAGGPDSTSEEESDDEQDEQDSDKDEQDGTGSSGDTDNGTDGTKGPASGEYPSDSSLEKQDSERNSDEGSDSEGDESTDEEDSWPDVTPEDSEQEEIDTGADQGEGGIQSDNHLSSDEIKELEVLTQELEQHGELADDSEDESSAVANAIVLGDYFETSPINIETVRYHKYDTHVIDESGSDLSEAWTGASPWAGYMEPWSYEISERIMGPALLKMRAAFFENQRAKEFHNRRSGRVDTRVLGRRVHHDDDRLFKKRVLPGKRNYEVVLALDISGSTKGTNLRLTKESVLLQAELCNRVGVKFSIYAHTATMASQESDGYALDLYEIKTIDEVWNKNTIQRLTDLHSSQGNLDGHALQVMRRQLDASSATDRVIIYYSDGKMPAANHDEELEVLQNEIRICKQRGYYLMGVGIRTDSPKEHGLDTVQVEGPEDVVLVVKHLERILSR